MEQEEVPEQQPEPAEEEADDAIKIRIDLGEGVSENIVVPKGQEDRASELAA